MSDNAMASALLNALNEANVEIPVSKKEDYRPRKFIKKERRQYTYYDLSTINERLPFPKEGKLEGFSDMLYSNGSIFALIVNHFKETVVKKVISETNISDESLDKLIFPYLDIPCIPKGFGPVAIKLDTITYTYNGVLLDTVKTIDEQSKELEEGNPAIVSLILQMLNPDKRMVVNVRFELTAFESDRKEKYVKKERVEKQATKKEAKVSTKPTVEETNGNTLELSTKGAWKIIVPQGSTVTVEYK